MEKIIKWMVVVGVYLVFIVPYLFIMALVSPTALVFYSEALQILIFSLMGIIIVILIDKFKKI